VWKYLRDGASPKEYVDPSDVPIQYPALSTVGVMPDATTPWIPDPGSDP
jgi:hypothetical protein